MKSLNGSIAKATINIEPVLRCYNSAGVIEEVDQFERRLVIKQLVS